MGFFKPATRTKSRLRLALDGVSGSGKTFTALRFAFALGKRVAVINTESGAIQKYLGLAPDGVAWNFDICELTNFAPTSYTQAIFAAGQEGFDVLLIDSLSHAWSGAGGALELKDKQATGRGENSFTAWKTVTPMHNQMIEAILRSPCHIIATMRSKTDYVIEANANGKSIPRKVGTCPIQRAGMEYEFDLYGSIDQDHILSVTKSRCPHPSVVDALVVKPDANWIAPVVDWLNDGLDIPADAFAVTEADLAKFEQRQSQPQIGAGARGAEPPKTLSVTELLKASTAAAAPAPALGQSPTVAAVQQFNAAEQLKAAAVQQAQNASPSLVATENPLFCSAAQRDSLYVLFKLLNQSEDQIANILKKRAVQAVADLTPAQADEIIGKLAAKAKEQGLVVETAAREPQGPPICSAEQLQRAQQLLLEAEQVTPGVSQRVAELLKTSNRAQLSQLRDYEARDLITALESKQVDKFFENWIPF